MIVLDVTARLCATRLHLHYVITMVMGSLQLSDAQYSVCVCLLRKWPDRTGFASYRRAGCPCCFQIYVEALVKAIPPEFHKTMQRIENGDILDSDQLSSEVDEASFDFYRRGIRMAMTGLQGEELKDRSMRRLRLGMGQVSPLAEVWQQHHHEQLMESTLGAARQRRHDGTSSSEQPDLPILVSPELGQMAHGMCLLISHSNFLTAHTHCMQEAMKVVDAMDCPPCDQ